MSAFSDVYQTLTEGRKIKVYEMADFLSITPATLYQILNGKRKPGSMQIAEKIVSYLNLSPEESQRLKEAAKRTLAGEEAYWQRKACADFLQTSLHELLPKELFGYSGSVPHFQTVEALHATSQIQKALLTLGAVKTEGCLNLVLPFHCPDLMLIVQSLSACTPGLAIRQIAALPRHLDEARQVTGFFQDLKILLSLYLSFDEYSALTFGEEENGSMRPFPYFAQSPKGVLLVSRTCSEGLLIQNEEAARAYAGQLEQFIGYCQPIFEKKQSLAELFAYYAALQREIGSTLIAYSRQLCSTPLMTPSLIENILNPDIVSEPDFASFGTIQNAVHFLSEYCAAQRKQWQTVGQALFFFEDGIRAFLETGILYEFPSNLCRPLAPAERLEVVERLIESLNTLPYKMLRHGSGDVQSGFGMLVSSKHGCLQIRRSDGRLVVLTIRSLKLLSIFRDYFASLNEENYYSKEETRNRLLRLLDEYKKRFS